MINEVPDDIDFDMPKPVGDLKTLTATAKRLQTLQKELRVLEQSCKDKKKEISQLESQELPDLMDGCSVKTLTLDTGETLKCKSIVKAALPTKAAISGQKDPDKKAELEDRHADGLCWLRGNGGEEIIKNTIIVEFSKGQDNLVGDFIGKAEELELPYNRDEAVHNATLSKFVDEKMQAGVEVPMLTLGVYCGRKAEVKKAR